MHARAQQPHIPEKNNIDDSKSSYWALFIELCQHVSTAAFKAEQLGQ